MTLGIAAVIAGNLFGALYWRWQGNDFAAGVLTTLGLLLFLQGAFQWSP